MSAALTFQRVLWKETRVLRQLWLLCGFGVMALMLLILAIAESNEHSQGYSEVFWVLTIWIPPIYVLAAVATMFAGEREEGTLTWLTTLAPRLTTLLGSRLVFLVASGLALQVWLAVTSGLLSQFDDLQESEIREDLIIMSFVLLEAIVYGMFWSLQTTRPLNAILYGAITIVVVNAGAVAGTEILGQQFAVRIQNPATAALGFWGWFRCLILFGVATANWGLAEQWLNGRPWDWEWLADWCRKLRLPRLDLVERMPHTLPRTDVADPWQRAWQRLRWLEWQGLKSYAWVILAMGAISCGSLLFARRPNPSFCFLFGWLSILLGGLAAWHGEQTNNSFRALVRMGISPAALWLNKLLCWFLAVAVALTFLVSTMLLTATILFNAFGDARFESWITKNFLEMNRSLPGASYWVPVAYVISLFCVAFVSAHLFRKSIVALGVALITGFLLTPWMFVCLEYQLPFLVFQLPIPLWLLWISWTALPAWWVEQTDWHISRRRIAELVFQTSFPLLIIGLAMGYRVWEVPRIPQPLLQAEMALTPSLNADPLPHGRQVQQQWIGIMNSMQQPVQEPTFEIPASAEGAATLQGLEGSGGMGAASGGAAMSMQLSSRDASQFGATPADYRRKYVELNREHLAKLRDQILAADYLSLEVAPSRGRRNQLYGPLLLYMAQEQLTAGDVEDSLKSLQAGVRLGGSLERFIPLEQQQSQQWELRIGELFEEMVRWAQHPQQTEVTLRRGMEVCALELRYWQVQPEEIRLQQEVDLERADFAYWFWERARARQLTEVAFSNRLWYFQQCQLGAQRPGMVGLQQMHSLNSLQYNNNPDGSTNSRLRAWTFYPVEVRRYQNPHQQMFAHVYGLSEATVESLHRMENRYHGTLAVMAVVGYRRLTGSLPESLLAVERYVPKTIVSHREGPSIISDLWTGNMFNYAPAGFRLKEPDFPADSIFRNPLLWSNHIRFQVSEGGNSIWIGNERVSGYEYGTNFSSVRGGIFPIPPQDPVDVSPATTETKETLPE